MCRRRRWITVVAMCLVAVPPVAACGGTAARENASAAGDIPVSARAGTPDTSEVQHVHALASADGGILVGTHRGLLRIGTEPRSVQISDQPFDVMALTADKGGLLASGHPAAGTDFPDPLGLGRSEDGGRTWAAVSQTGSVDFHKLQAAGDRVWGLAAGGALWRSVDAGRTWRVSRGALLEDLAVDPDDGRRLVSLRQSSVVMSRDGGATFSAWTGAPPLALVAWTTEGVYGVTSTGEVLAADDLGRPWQRRGRVPQDTQSIAPAGAGLIVATTQSIESSRDGGRTFVSVGLWR